MIRLGVNVDHVATIRQARGTVYPDPLAAALEATAGGADQITIHLREDRRHIRDADVARMKAAIAVPLNLEMSVSEEIVSIACRERPAAATLVPERRAELTTEGGLDVAGKMAEVRAAIRRLFDAGIEVSLFIDPDLRQVEAAGEAGARRVELHTGACCDAKGSSAAERELDRLARAAGAAKGMGFRLAAGHGINYENAATIARALPEVEEYNIGHAIVARALFVGMKEAVREMRRLLNP
ncbi:MAG: pyridoxine 5'-phosphate synthase [Proteobacteria bacterium]|nr:pyridoxine 5'-phosphate synthase [Pseudomonadota bacterium]